ncbi:hypothetical protein EVAR_59621_1 [Eumeta japonica]|uniref:Uncharacterized protein n=1 Tax=Eumeta variegata TaxID=151549 RepID=A0A4C1ZCV7_EUMVA|nr:hypothetical protein EVAR_59621_1 [Eumeta japonica]
MDGVHTVTTAVSLFVFSRAIYNRLFEEKRSPKGKRSVGRQKTDELTSSQTGADPALKKGCGHSYPKIAKRASPDKFLYVIEARNQDFILRRVENYLSAAATLTGRVASVFAFLHKATFDDLAKELFTTRTTFCVNGFFREFLNSTFYVGCH